MKKMFELLRITNIYEFSNRAIRYSFIRNRFDIRRNILLIAAIFTIYASASAQSLKEALRLTDNEQYESADDMYRALIAKEPQNINNYFYYGDNYFKAENPDSAKIVFKKGLSIDPNNALCTVGLGKLLLDEISQDEAKAEYDHAQQSLKKAQDIFDRNANKTDEDRTTLAHAKASMEEAHSKLDHAQAMIAEANVNFQKVLDATKMKDAAVLMEVAEALTQAKNKDLTRALDLLNKAVALDSKNAQILIRIGNVYIEQRNGNLAAEYFNKALDIDAKNLRAILQKGILYYRSINYEAAAAEFQRAMTIDPSFAPAHRQMGETYWKQNKVDLALKEYHQYLEINKGSESARIRYIAFLYLIKHYKDDIDEIARLPKFDSSSVMLSRIAGYSDYEIGDSVKALKLLSHVLQIVPEDKRISTDYKYYGRTLIKTGQDSLGIIHLQKASDLDSSDTDLMNEIANLYYKNKKYGEAATWFRKMIETKKESAKANDWFMLGKSYFFNKNYPDADTAFAKLNELSPAYLSGYLWRAQNLMQIDTSSKEGLAKPFYEKVIELGTADSATATKSCQQLIQSYSYLASFYAQKKDNENTLLFLKKEIALPCLDPSEKKRLIKVIDQIEHPPVVVPKGKK